MQFHIDIIIMGFYVGTISWFARINYCIGREPTGYTYYLPRLGNTEALRSLSLMSGVGGGGCNNSVRSLVPTI